MAHLSDTAPFSMVVFLLVVIAVIVFVILEPKVRVPFTKWHFVMDQAQPPLIGVLILWICQATNWDTIWYGIRGEDGVKPYSILILFNALAYVSISVDSTGLFAWMAVHISKRAGTQGHRLFFYFFLFEAAMTIVTSNDTVILTLTPIIYYTCVCTAQPPLAFLLSMYYTANIFSMTLFVGSPTNIIIVQAKGLTFIRYLKFMILPSVVAGVTAYAMSHWHFRKDINPTFRPMDIDPKVALVDTQGAIFGAINLLLSLVFLAIYDQLKPLELWHIGLFFGVVQFIANLVLYVWRGHEAPNKFDEAEARMISKQQQQEQEQQQAASDAEDVVKPSITQDSEPANPPLASAGSEIALTSVAASYAASDTNLTSPKSKGEPHLSRQKSATGLQLPEDSEETQRRAILKLKQTLNKKLTIWTAIEAMPYKVVPFAGGMFILVNILRKDGWVDLLAEGMATADTLPRSVWLWALVPTLFCNFMNDQPTSILFTYVLINPNYYNNVPGGLDGAISDSAIWTLSMATNLGVCFTMIGALAGIMWSKILNLKGVKTGYISYLKYSSGIIAVTIILTTFSIWVELL